MSGEGDDGIDAAAVMAAETNPSCSARPRPPAPVAPGDPAPSAGTRIGRVVAVRKVYDRYLSVEQRDVEVDAAGAKVREKERTGLFSSSSSLDSFSARKPALPFYLLSPRSLPPSRSKRTGDRQLRRRLSPEGPLRVRRRVPVPSRGCCGSRGRRGGRLDPGRRRCRRSLRLVPLLLLSASSFSCSPDGHPPPRVLSRHQRLALHAAHGRA